MGKSGLRGMGTLAAGGAVVYFAFWLYQKVGWVAILGVVCVCAAAYAGKLLMARRRKAAAFNKLVRYLLVKRLPHGQTALLDSALVRKNPARAELIDRIRKLHDAMETALSSTQRETAESGMQTVRALHDEIQQEYSGLISAQLMAEIDDVIARHEQAFDTRLYTNVAQGLLEKADRVADTQTRLEYATLALETVDEGTGNPRSEKQTLEAMRQQAERVLQSCNEQSETVQPQHG